MVAGGVLYETSQQTLHSGHNQELMTDWTPALSGMSGLRRGEKDHIKEHLAAPSPTYPHLSAPESHAQSSSYGINQSVMLPGQSPAYHAPYPSLSGSHLQSMQMPVQRYNHGHTYYPTSNGTADYDGYQNAGPSRQKGSGYNEQYHQHIMYDASHNAQPLLTTTSLARSYDSTIPSYYPVTTDSRSSWNHSSAYEKSDEKVGSKRKREKKNPPANVKGAKTPKPNGKQVVDDGTGRTAKRVKLEDDRKRSNSQQSHLPTPPSTGRDLSDVSLPPHLQQAIVTEMEEMPENQQGPVTRRRGVIVTRHEDEGRKLGLVGRDQPGAENSIEEALRSPRTTTAPVLSTSAAGLASLSTDEVLQSEMAWLESGGIAHSPPSPPAVVQSPTMDVVVPEEDPEAPEVEEEKTSRRLLAFAEDSRVSEPMVSTRVGDFGRVAVRKDAAVKFLGLDGSAQMIEEVHLDEEDDQQPVAGCSKSGIEPNWPDELVPWCLAGYGWRKKVQRELEERAALLKRYIETSSDDGSDPEDVLAPPPSGKGKGKSVVHFLSSSDSSRHQRLSSNHHPAITDAKSALLVSIRNRSLPSIPSGVVACLCGNPTTTTMGSMISCASCKTWHHIVCCGIEDEAQLRSHWWCSACETQAMALSTPANNIHRPVYAQSDERSSAFRGDLSNVALAPSPMFAVSTLNARTPLGGPTAQSPGRPQRSRVLSYGVDMWAFTEDGAPPSTPAPSRPDRFSTPRADDAPFDVTSTPSRHIDFNFGQPSLFSLTPLGGRSRVTSNLGGILMDATPFRAKNPAVNTNLSEAGLPRSDFFRELNKAGSSNNGHGFLDGVRQAPHTEGGMGSPHARWTHGLLGAHPVSPSPYAHRRSVSGNKLSSMRSSSRSGLGLGMPGDKNGDGDE